MQVSTSLQLVIKHNSAVMLFSQLQTDVL